MMKSHPMNRIQKIYFIYQKDFTEKGNDRYFIYENKKFSEVTSEKIISLDALLITHDFWLIAPSIYNKHKKLPSKILEITLLSRIIKGIKSIKGDTQAWDILETIKPLYANPDQFEQYLSMYYRRTSLETKIYKKFATKLKEYTKNILDLAKESNELHRFYDLELPIFNLLTHVVCKGLPISQEILVEHKTNIKNDYYRTLKDFAEKHNVLYELPNEHEIKYKLSSLGYDIEHYNIDFLIDFLPSQDGYTDDVKKLKKINKSYKIFNNISSTSKRLHPIVDTHSTSTSRIYYKSPNLQNLSKRYRNIFIADKGMKLSYIDYDQFEVGIMAAMSGDNVMADLYKNKDAYSDLSNIIFGAPDYRKKCKVFFLSYTYGMSLENILIAVEKQGGNKGH